jgi:hypothetical protein
MDLAKHLVDLMHEPYMMHKKDIMFRKNNPDRVTLIETTRIARMIREIRFYDSIVAIFKQKERPLPISEHL